MKDIMAKMPGGFMGVSLLTILLLNGIKLELYVVVIFILYYLTDLIFIPVIVRNYVVLYENYFILQCFAIIVGLIILFKRFILMKKSF